MEANRRLHFVSVMKKMRQAWDDNEAERVGLVKASSQNSVVRIQNEEVLYPCKPIPLATHCPEKSSRPRDEANHGTHSGFCRENGWISLFRLAGVSGAAGYVSAAPVSNEPDGIKSSSPFDGRMRAIPVLIAPPAPRSAHSFSSEMQTAFSVPACRAPAPTRRARPLWRPDRSGGPAHRAARPR